jgi:Zn-finger nucleic acid-binding protein
MNCPKCEQPLSTTSVRGTEVDKCPKCHGIWFDANELETILAQTPTDLRPLRGGRHDNATDRQRGTCPRDGKSLMRVCSAKDKDVIVDVCPDCQGIWLDGGELKRLLD